MTLKVYEEEILRRMYNEELIGNNYKSVQTVRSKIRWIEISQKYRIKRKFESIMRRLEGKGYVNSHGKSGTVYSLTFTGIAYAVGTSK